MRENIVVLDLSRLVKEHGEVPNEQMGYSDPAIYFDDYTGGTKDFRITLLNMGVHSGTHCDTPSHFLFDTNGPLGKTISDYDISTFVGRALILNFKNHGPISQADLVRYKANFKGSDSIVVIWNEAESDSFTPKAREELASWKPKLIIAGQAWDHLSAEDPKDLLYPDTAYYCKYAQIPVIMDPDHAMMSRVRDDDLIIAAPVKYDGVEAAPVRLIAIKGFST